jgi:SAM-dependent methyltransferase
MFRILKKILPTSIKQQIREYILGLVQSSTQQYEDQRLRIDHLQAHVENLTTLITSTAENLNAVGQSLQSIHQTQAEQLQSLTRQLTDLTTSIEQSSVQSILQQRSLPEILPHDTASLAMIQDFKKQFNVDFEVDINISKNDIMFLYSLAAYHDFNIALHHYLTIGYNGFSIVKEFVEAIHGPQKFEGQILDFASGYGRVTRFLAAYFGAGHICTSDIKSEAVEFQIKQFQVNGFTSSYDPTQLKPNQTFDFIFVGSLFSHLNETLFSQWLSCLMGLLNPKGYLIFTVHDQSLHPGHLGNDFAFVESNEDEKFQFVGNRITSTQLYGISFVSEKFVAAALQQIHPQIKYMRFPKLFGAHQDVYLATQDGNLPDANQLKNLYHSISTQILQ